MFAIEVFLFCYLRGAGISVTCCCMLTRPCRCVVHQGWPRSRGALLGARFGVAEFHLHTEPIRGGKKGAESVLAVLLHSRVWAHP